MVLYLFITNGIMAHHPSNDTVQNQSSKLYYNLQTSFKNQLTQVRQTHIWQSNIMGYFTDPEVTWDCYHDFMQLWHVWLYQNYNQQYMWWDQGKWIVCRKYFYGETIQNRTIELKFSKILFGKFKWYNIFYFI